MLYLSESQLSYLIPCITSRRLFIFFSSLSNNRHFLCSRFRYEAKGCLRKLTLIVYYWDSFQSDSRAALSSKDWDIPMAAEFLIK